MNRIFIIALLLCVNMANAQYLSLAETSHLSGINSVNFNPALMANSSYHWQLNLGSINTQLTPNGFYNSNIPFSKLLLNFNKQSLRTGTSNILGPSFMFQTKKYGSIGLATKYLTYQSGNEALYNLFIKNTPQATLQADKSTSMAVKTLALAYAYPISFKEHSINIGFSYLSHALYYADELTYNGDSFSHTGFQSGQKFSIGNIFKAKSNSSGFDIGAVYAFRPKYQLTDYDMDGKKYLDPQKSNYLLRLGLSISNVGIAGVTKNTTMTKADKTIDPATLKATAFGTEYNGAVSKLGINNNTTENSTLTGEYFSPKLNTFLEVALGKKGWSAGIISSKATNKALNYTDQLTISPRFEKNNNEFALPISFLTQSKQQMLGLHIRLGTLFFGVNSINGFLSNKAPSPGYYIGFSLGKKASKIKDKDNDKVSDALDKCIDLPGLMAFKGCPDTDNDGVEDKLDKCPDHAGPAATNGCPDTDNDGIFDSQDACPNQAGIAKFNGCPDTDGDGIMDSEDDCPNKAGRLEDGGCPDTDGDGIIDSKDACPTVKGSKEKKGCP